MMMTIARTRNATGVMERVNSQSRHRLTIWDFDAEEARSSVKLVTKVGSSPPKGVAPCRATALMPQGTLQDLLL